LTEGLDRPVGAKKPSKVEGTVREMVVSKEYRWVKYVK